MIEEDRHHRDRAQQVKVHRDDFLRKGWHKFLLDHPANKWEPALCEQALQMFTEYFPWGAWDTNNSVVHRKSNMIDLIGKDIILSHAACSSLCK
jgi:hypothetical protein